MNTPAILYATPSLRSLERGTKEGSHCKACHTAMVNESNKKHRREDHVPHQD